MGSPLKQQLITVGMSDKHAFWLFSHCPTSHKLSCYSHILYAKERKAIKTIVSSANSILETPWGTYYLYHVTFCVHCLQWCVSFVCLFVLSFSSHSGIFHLYGDITITGEGLQILMYTRHSWPSSRGGSLTCHTYCDIGNPFIMVISEEPWHSHLMSSVWQWSCHYLF